MCIKRIVTCTLYAICIATLIFAVSFMSVGSTLTVGIASYMEDILTYLVEGDKLKNLYLSAVYLMTAVGAMLFFTAAVGCWGACCHSECYLLMFNITTGVIVLLVLVAGGLASGFKATLSEDQQAIQNNFTEQVQHLYGVPAGNKNINRSWDNMQSKLGCCGAESYEDWRGSDYFTETLNVVPRSCCVLYNDGDITNTVFTQCKNEAGKASPNITIVYTDGCIEAFTQDANTNADIVMGVGFSFGILNLIAVLVGCCLRNKLGKEDD